MHNALVIALLLGLGYCADTGSGTSKPEPMPVAEPTLAKSETTSPPGQCSESQTVTGASGCGCNLLSRAAGPGAAGGTRRKLVAKGSAPGAVVPLTRLIPIPGGKFEMGTQPKAFQQRRKTC